MINIDAIPAFSDNYIWGLYDKNTKQAVVVDPGEASPVLIWLQQHGLTLSSILITHHHPDHTGGIDTLLTNQDIKIYGPASNNIPQITHPLQNADTINPLSINFRVINIPGHTLDHIAYYADEADGILFCGDTLFAGGCGRIFEGNPKMMQESLSKLASLPKATNVYCAHEYTLANLEFAISIEPNNKALKQRILDDTAQRKQNLPTLPSTIDLEQKTNPFLRCHEVEVIAKANERRGTDCKNTVEVFATIRGWKDNY